MEKEVINKWKLAFRRARGQIPAIFLFILSARTGNKRLCVRQKILSDSSWQIKTINKNKLNDTEINPQL